MMKVSEFVGHLKTVFPTTKFYNGSINKAEKQCVGVYARGGAGGLLALGGKAYTSYAVLPITLLVHWSEDSDVCETKANEIFEYLFGLSNITIGGRRLIQVRLPDSSPIDVGRDEGNISERTIHAHLFYER